MSHEIDDVILFGKNAKQILESITFKTVIQSIKEDVFHDWQTTSTTQEKEREKLYSLLKAVDLLEEKMWAVSDNAHVLKINSDKLKSRK
tara:strand:+ start:104 stop:370 length:267 start_codon:yes stop_codon:yes gene_type:complete